MEEYIAMEGIPHTIKEVSCFSINIKKKTQKLFSYVCNPFSINSKINKLKEDIHSCKTRWSTKKIGGKCNIKIRK